MKSSNSESRALAVDLDGTLVLCDTSVRSSFVMLRKSPLRFLKNFPQLFIHRARYKEVVAQYHIPDPKLLPWCQPVLDFITEEFKKGRKIYLATGTNIRTARAIADSVTLFKFTDVFASDTNVSLTGKNKAEALCKNFGEGNFDYMGNDWIDLEVWAKGHTPIVCNAPEALVLEVRKTYSDVVVIS